MGDENWFGKRLWQGKLALCKIVIDAIRYELIASKLGYGLFWHLL